MAGADFVVTVRVKCVRMTLYYNTMPVHDAYLIGAWYGRHHMHITPCTGTHSSAVQVCLLASYPPATSVLV